MKELLEVLLPWVNLAALVVLAGVKWIGGRETNEVRVGEKLQEFERGATEQQHRVGMLQLDVTALQLAMVAVKLEIDYLKRDTRALDRQLRGRAEET